MVGAYNPETFVIVSKSQRNDIFDQTVLGDPFGLLQGDVPRGKIDMIDAGEDQLKRTAFGSDNQINALGILGHFVFELILHEEQYGENSQAQSQEQNVQSGI